MGPPMVGFLIAIIAGALADSTWGGRLDKYIPGARRIIALVILGAAFSALFNVWYGLTVLTGYLARRILGWRTLWSGELFLDMRKPLHAVYMAIHSLPLLLIPFIWTAAGPGVFTWPLFTGLAAALGLGYYVIINLGHKRVANYIGWAELYAGAIMGAAFYVYGAGL